MEARKGTRVLVLCVDMAQKNREVLELIAAFVHQWGINSRLVLSSTGIFHLRIWRIKDIISFLSHLTLVVKARQVQASLDYLEGRITGNNLLSIFNEDFLMGRRRRVPLGGREWNRVLTHAEANAFAKKERSEAAMAARNCMTKSDRSQMVLKLPPIFDVKDAANMMGVNTQRARYVISLMRRDGLIKSEIHSRSRTLVCTRLI